MIGPAYYLIGALALVLLQPSSALTATTANQVCNLLADGTNIYSGADCSQYYSCLGGVATLATCSSGYSFSKDSQNCQPSSQVTCVTANTNPCLNAANGAFVAVPTSCTDYYYCSNGVGSRGSCPSGLNFDQPNQSCNYTTDYVCTSSNNGANGDSAINLCAVVPSGMYFGSSSSCQAWQECSLSGVLTSGVCPSPYYYNVATAACDYKENVSCRQVNNDPSTGTNPGVLAGKACTTNGLVVSDNTTCTGYYLCSNNVYSYGSCTGGLYFNPPTSTCVNRLNAINNCNRCQGTSLEFVNLYEDNCKGYGYCLNGRVDATGNCTNGYFNEVMQACVQDGEEPDFLVCNTNLAQNTTTDASVTTQSTTTDAIVTTQSTTTDAIVTTQSTTTDASGLTKSTSTTSPTV